MAAAWKSEFITATFSVVIFCLTICSEVVQGQGTPQFLALMVLGDSTLDAGNNNRINTPAKCNFSPYGRDFPGGVPTGRFSNGKLTSDFLASGLGIKEIIPTYLDPQLASDDLVTRVTLASASSSYDNATSKSGNVVSFDQQISYLRQYQSLLRGIIGEQKASIIISDSLYYIGTRNVDFGVSYFNFNPRNLRYNRVTQFTISQYVNYLVSLGADHASSWTFPNFDMFRNRKKGVTKIEGTVVLRKASLLDAKDLSASFGDRLFELMQQKVYFQLVSSDQIDKETRHGKRSRSADLEWYLLPSLEYLSKDSTHRISFKWAPEMGTPGAVLVTNNHSREFFLKELSIQIPEKGDIRFLCNSWIYPKWMTNFCSNLTAERVFFANNSYLPDETPIGLVDLRNAELVTMKANDTGERKTRDRIYDYDVYNDLGDPDNKKKLERKVLGGSQELPYPRRCRTGRPRSKTSPAFESIKQSFYIPSDEQFPQECLSDFRAHFLKAFCKVVIPAILSTVKREFSSLKEVQCLYSKGISFFTYTTARLARQILPGQMIKGILNTDDQAILRFPLPSIISKDDDAWMTEEEFGRQTLSGLNPMVIRCLQSFPPSSSLNAQIYGSQQSEITAEHILKNLDGISVEEAIKSKRLFILDYYDAYMPYVELVNQLPSAKAYATRSIFFLAETGALNPVAIELCLPPTSVGLGSRCVYTPDNSGEDEGWLWRLAKAHVRSNDSGYHQLVSHWLRTHAVVEPFIIATHRNLSKLHPLHKLLLPHFRNTMEINRSARQSLINAGGIIEQCFTSGRYSMEISSKAYMDWRFNEQGLPADLLKRGMAVRDPTDKENGLSLVIKDYPYAVDGLEIWAALKSWVSDYTALYYKDDHAVQSDKEVQAWWKEIVEVGHGDKKHDETGWYKMKSVEDVIESITTLIWIASAHHAAVNFGQYGYAGFMPNHPSTTRKHIPEKGSPQYSEFLRDREAYFLKTVSNPRTATTTMAVLELLSRHSSDEVYLGQGSASIWTDDSRVETAFERFRSKLRNIEKNIEMRNHDPSLPNRRGPAQVPYTLLYPGTSDTPETGVGLTFRGIPNSVSI